jgi:hypothetical protein
MPNKVKVKVSYDDRKLHLRSVGFWSVALFIYSRREHSISRTDLFLPEVKDWGVTYSSWSGRRTVLVNGLTLSVPKMSFFLRACRLSLPCE